MRTWQVWQRSFAAGECGAGESCLLSRRRGGGADGGAQGAGAEEGGCHDCFVWLLRKCSQLVRFNSERL